ncbi:MAG TPA: zinc ribbon domain-containing protein [Pirellulales bacterium]|jgi:putative FmdB family regulatory protein
MPTYDYVCDACHHEFELFQSITEAKKRKCPKCGKNKLRRLIGTGAAIMFKGSGFYQTDYRSDSYKQKAEADKPKSNDSASNSGNKSDSKSEGKSESKSESKSEAKSDTSSDKSAGSKGSSKKK